MNRAQLTARYNEIATQIASLQTTIDASTATPMVASVLEKTYKQVKIFKDLPTAQERVERITDDLNVLLEVSKPKKAEKAPKAPRVGKKRGWDVNYPATPDCGKSNPKAGSMRARVLSMVQAGTTFKAAQALVAEEGKVNEATLPYRTFRLLAALHFGYGYGLKHDLETGKITLIEWKE